jgi:RNA polymerase sigma-70 factor (ECF subfamily)
MNEEREDRWRAWMIAAQGGDSASYEKLLQELLPHVRNLVRRRLFDPHAVEDVVQNVFISLHRARRTYRPERPLLPWVGAIARNAAVDFMRDRQRRGQREISLELDSVPEPSVEAVTPGEHELDPALRAALEQLSATQREAVELIHLAGLSVAEAADRAGVSRGALKVRAHRGYRALRAILANPALSALREEEGG